MTDTNFIRTRIADELNRTDLSTQINREINSAIKHYESMRVRWTEVKDWIIGTTVSGQRSYSLTVNFLKMDSVKLHYNTAYITLNKRSWGEMEEKDLSIDNSIGIPQDYVIYADSIRLFPVPNGAYTLQGSYIRRELPTSLTGRFTSTGTITPTTTASHNNRSGGWYEHGEELIRYRAKAAVAINYIKNPTAMQEAGLLAVRGDSFLSVQEKQAYQALRDETNDALSVGRVRPYFI